MAHKKAGGSAKNLTDSKAKYLGVKLYAGQMAQEGSIIVRQRGSRMLAGLNTAMGKDHTIFAKKAGVVSFRKVRGLCFDGTKTLKSAVDVTTK